MTKSVRGGMPGRTRTEIHLAGEDTDGPFCLFVDDPPAGWSLPAHLHHATGETIDIFEGEFEMGDRRTATSGAPGDTTHIPPDVVHAASQSPGRRSVIFSPAGKENFFVEAGTSSEDREVDLRTALAAAAAMGWQFIT